MIDAVYITLGLYIPKHKLPKTIYLILLLFGSYLEFAGVISFCENITQLDYLNGQYI